MSTIPTAPGIESLTLIVTKEIQVEASSGRHLRRIARTTRAAEHNARRVNMPMKLEAWPGGRWLRDLGDNNGHFWGHVQAIKRPTLLEISGPLFMSYAAVSNVQYRLSEANGGTLITFHHKAMGAIQDDHREGVARAGRTFWTAFASGPKPGRVEERGYVSGMSGDGGMDRRRRDFDRRVERSGGEQFSDSKAFRARKTTNSSEQRRIDDGHGSKRETEHESCVPDGLAGGTEETAGEGKGVHPAA